MSAGFEAAFAAALLRPHDVDPDRSGQAASAGDPAARADVPAFARQLAFAVYRNNIVSACVEALRANYPSVAQIVGEAWFADAAVLFVRGALPTDGRLSAYGAGFAEFLRGFEPAADLPYLAGVAQLDRCWTEAHLAADAPPLPAAALAALTPDEFAAVGLVPHPAARWMWFESAPVFTIWQRHRDAAGIDDELAWHGEGALLTRPAGVVRWQALSAAGCGFLDACAAGARFGEAASLHEAALADLPALLVSGAFRTEDRAAPSPSEPERP